MISFAKFQFNIAHAQRKKNLESHYQVDTIFQIKKNTLKGIPIKLADVSMLHVAILGIKMPSVIISRSNGDSLS